MTLKITVRQLETAVRRFFFATCAAAQLRENIGHSSYLLIFSVFEKRNLFRPHSASNRSNGSPHCQNSMVTLLTLAAQCHWYVMPQTY